MTQTVAAPRPETGAPRQGRHANATLLVLFLSLGGLAFATLQSLVAPALPVIAQDLRASTGDISWVLTARTCSPRRCSRRSSAGSVTWSASGACSSRSS